MRSKAQDEAAARKKKGGAAVTATDAKTEVLSQKFPFLAMPDKPEVRSM